LTSSPRTRPAKGVLVLTDGGRDSLEQDRHTWAEAEPANVAEYVLEAVKRILQDGA